MPKRALKRRKDGRYLCWYMGVPFYGHSSDEAMQLREDYKRGIQITEDKQKADTVVAEYATKWVVSYKSETNFGTYNAYVHYLNVICDDIGQKKIRDVTATDIRNIYRKQSGLSASHLRKFCSTCKSMFNSAVADGIITVNPCTTIKRPKGEDGTHRALEEWEDNLLMSMVGIHDLALAAMAMRYGGLRRGEAVAFNIDRDIEFDKGIVYVRETVAFVGNRPKLKKPKTDAGIRELPLFDPLRFALEGKHGLLLEKRSGGMMTQSAFLRRWDSFIVAMETKLNGCEGRWYGHTKEHKAILKAGGTLPPWLSVTIRAHDLRHSFATMLYNAGVDLKTAIKWMGHADETMIVRIYAHLTAKKEKEAERAVGKLINDRLYSQNDSQSIASSV